MFQGKQRGMSSQLNPERLKEDSKKDGFTFLIPEIPPLKNGKNVIPTGKQIPRTPLKCEIVVTKPSTETDNDSELCGVDIDESLFKNMIPKGREIPRTPPNYSSRPFLLSGSQLQPPSFDTSIDLGVKPLEDEDDLNNFVISVENITVRKRPMPKSYDLDSALSEIIENVNLENGMKGLLVDVSQKISSDSNICGFDLAVPCMGENSLKGNVKPKEHTVVGESITCVTNPSEEVVVETKRGRTRRIPKKTSALSKQEGEDSNTVEVQKQRKCRSKSKARVSDNNSKGNVDLGVDGPIVKDVQKQEKVLAVEKKKGRVRRAPKTSSTSKQDKECFDTDIKLEMDKNKENVFVTKQELEKSVVSSEKGRKKSNKRENCDLPSDLQTRRNPSRRAKEGINYCLPEE